MSAIYQSSRFFAIDPYKHISEDDHHPEPRSIPMVLNNCEIGYAVITANSPNNSRMLTCVFFDQHHAKQRVDGEIEYSLNPQKTIVNGREMFFFETVDFFEKK